MYGVFGMYGQLSCTVVRVTPRARAFVEKGNLGLFRPNPSQTMTASPTYLS